MATLIVVRRDASATFQRLEPWARSPGSDLTLIVDRRRSDRRHGDAVVLVERRAGERRQPGAEELTVLDQPRRGGRRQQAEWPMPERRQVERRRRMPDTWGTLGLLMVYCEDRPA
jgi:hypothetical protein